MKRVLTIIISAALMSTIAACSIVTPASAGDALPTTTSAASTGEPVTIEPSSMAQQPAANQQAYAAFSNALENLIQNRVLPDGTPSDEQDSTTPSRFAVYDVDGDGQDELILLNNTMSMAGTTGYVFDYEEGSEGLQTELVEYVDLTFYDNGLVKAGWSHNQGLAGDHFWPYNLLQYDASIDCYRPYYSVDAWDKAYGEANEQGETYPTEIDKSNAGIVYYIMQGMDFDYSNPVDQSEYTAWLDQQIGSAKELQLSYLDLTVENVALLRSMS